MSALTGARHASFAAMIRMLETQQAHKLDVVAPAAALYSRNACIQLRGVQPITIDPVITPEGVTSQLDPNGVYRPTTTGDATIAAKLGIDRRYLRRLRAERPDMYDANVNGWLHGRSVVRAGIREQVYPDDERSFLLRLFFSDDGGEGIMRALLSDRYGIIDNLDVLVAVMDGVKQADADVQIRSGDLTESSMHVKVFSPGIQAQAPHFLGGYRNPFANPELEKARQEVSRWRGIADREGMGYALGTEPVVFAGLRFSNDETGGGKVSLKPELFVRICHNGLTLPAFEGIKKVHLGSRMGEGVQWSADTQRKEIEQRAGAPVHQPEEAIKVVGKQLGFTETERTGILAHFIAGGQLTAAGIANAVTSFSQTVADADRADCLDSLALRAMALAA